MFSVYEIRNQNTGKIYLGKTGKTIAKRWLEHKSSAKTGLNTYLCKSIRKHGPEAFTISTLALTPREDFAFWLERMFIRTRKASCPDVGYNLSEGGEGVTPNEATRKKLSDTMKARGIHPPLWSIAKGAETRRRNGTLHAPRSAETIEKIRAAQKGRPLTEEHKAALRAAKRKPTRPDIVNSEIVRAYESGESTLTLARKLNTNHQTIRQRLIDSGVKMRPRGRPHCLSLTS